MVTFAAVYDACVLYPAPLRDLLMHLALTDLFRARWTDMIHDEWMRNVREDRPDLAPQKLARVRRLMDEHVLDSLVTGHEQLIELLTLPDPGDRHVLAAAIRAEASVIVTYNLSDFPSGELKQYGIRSQHPDDFILRLLEIDPQKVIGAIREQRANIHNPAKSAEELLATYEQQRLVKTVSQLRQVIHLI